MMPPMSHLLTSNEYRLCARGSHGSACALPWKRAGNAHGVEKGVGQQNATTWRFAASFSEPSAISEHEAGNEFRRELTKRFFSVIDTECDADAAAFAAQMTPAHQQQLRPRSVVQVRCSASSVCARVRQSRLS